MELSFMLIRRQRQAYFRCTSFLRLKMDFVFFTRLCRSKAGGTTGTAGSPYFASALGHSTHANSLKLRFVVMTTLARS
jgi:hypothetical protein